MQVTKEKLQAEFADLSRRRAEAAEMVLRYDGAMQAVEALIVYIDQPDEAEE